MDTRPGEVEIGDRLSQEEVEEVFDTGFGYRISGINPRRDDNGNRSYYTAFYTDLSND